MPRTLPALLLAFASLPAAAATFSVSNINDDGAGSLRAAIVAANAAGDATGPHRIEFTSAYPLNGEIELLTALPRINVILEIDGNGRAPVLRPFDTTQDLRLLASSDALTLRRFTLQQGRAAGGGGCLASDGAGSVDSLVLDRMRFVGCLATGSGATSASGGAVRWSAVASVGVFETVFEANGAAHSGTGAGTGGAMSISGPLLVQSSRFIDNASNGGFTSGGAISWLGATASTVEIRDSVFIGNFAVPEAGGSGFGGALALDCPSCTLSIVRSYFGGNRSADAGAVFARGNNGEGSAQITLENLSFIGNRVSGDGGALITQGARLVGRHLTFFSNQADLGAHLTTSSTQLVEWSNSAMAPKRAGSGIACALSGAAASTLGTLLATGDSSCSAGLPGAVSVADLQVLGVDEAESMPVLSFDTTSPAVDGANASRCLPTDARGVARPQDGNGDGSAACDVGAFELQALELFADGFED